MEMCKKGLWIALCALLWTGPVWAEDALTVLEREHPAVASALSDSERDLLRQLASEDLEDYLRGVDPATIRLATGESLAEYLGTQGMETFTVSKYSIDGGGGRVSGGNFSLIGSVGQPDAGRSSGGSYVLYSGFWAPVPSEEPLFSDGLDSGDLSGWDLAVGVI